MQRTLVLNVVGLTGELLGPHTPNLLRVARQGAQRSLRTVCPAVTCAAQATFMTGKLPAEHGIVGNGWYFRDLAEVWFWRQSHHLVSGEKIWETAKRRDPSFTCAKLFWWYNMYSQADYSVTPRPMYPADGRKIPDIYTQPASLRSELNEQLGPFPLFHFWGPQADIRSCEWIRRCAHHVERTRRPTLNLVYLPHLDYNLQRLGPRHPKIAQDLREVDDVCGSLIEEAEQQGTRVVVVSEYGITEVSGPVHINRALRGAGLLAVREELGRDVFDAGGSRAFAVSDHQVAHVYVRDSGQVEEVRRLVRELDGVERVLDREEQREIGLDHPRSGELVAISRPDRWFTYYYWLDPDKAPDYAPTVDIHRKPGYDPAELFFDPRLRFPKVKAARRLARKKLGFRTLMDVISTDPSLVRGSHGRPTDRPEAGPVLLSNCPDLVPHGDSVPATGVKDLVLSHLFD